MGASSKFDLLWSRLCSCCSRDGGKKKTPKTVNIFFGFFLVINYCLGTGFLGIPYAFFYGGYLAAIPTVIFISFVSWINGNYLLEVMSRAQVSILVRSLASRSKLRKGRTAITKSSWV